MNKKGIRIKAIVVMVTLLMLGAFPIFSEPAYAATSITGADITVEDTVYHGKNTKTAIEVYYDYDWLDEGTDYTVTYSNNSKVGTATATITGKGKYSGTVVRTFKINALNVNDCYVYANEYEDLYYTGGPIKKDLSISYDDREGEFELKEGTDYVVEYKNNVNVGKATYTIKGIGNCTGTRAKDEYGDPLTFRIHRADIEEAVITGLKSVTYRSDGKYSQTPVVTFNGKTLKEGVDYTFEVDGKPEETDKGYAVGYVYVYGKGNFEGSTEKAFKINYIDISPATLVLKSGNSIPYHDIYLRYEIADYIDVKYNGKTLKCISEYDYDMYDDGKYDCYIEVVSISGTKVSVKAVGTGIYEGETKQFAFTLKRGLSGWVDFDDIKGASYDKDDNITVPYTGKQIKPKPVMHGALPKSEVTLKAGKDYTVVYKNNINAGTAKVEIIGKGEYAGQKRGLEFKIVPANMNSISISGIEDKKYTGKAIAQSPTLKYNGLTLKNGTDYTLSYKNNTKVGTATVVIKGKGNYTGSVSKTFNIINKKTVWKRLWGNKALDTMAAITKEFGKSEVAIVTTNADFKDALSAAALAGRYSAPVLMTAPNKLSGQTKSELKRMGVKTVYILGSKTEVSKAVESQIKAAGVKTVKRYSGASASARAIAASNAIGKGNRSDTVIIATQAGFYDALSVSPFAYASKSPILYVESNLKLSKDTLNHIKSGGFKKAVIVGGPAAIPAAVEKQLVGAGIKASNITRLAGAKAYETSRIIAEWVTGKLKTGANTGKLYKYARIKFQPMVKMGTAYVGVATGKDWYDALAGAALCGKYKGVLLLEDDSNYSNTSFTKANKDKISVGYVFGGKVAISEKVYKACQTSTK